MNNDTPADAMGLKPCPFCGGEADVITPDFPLFADCADIYITCTACNCIGKSILFDQDSHDADDLEHLTSEAIAAWNTRTTSLAAQDGLVDALRYARSQIVGLAVSGTDRIDELCRKLQQMDPSPIWPIPFPDPPERTWQPIVKRIDAALASIEVKS